MKRILSISLALALMLSCAAALAQDSELPISQEPITLTAWVLDVNNVGIYEDSVLWDWLEEKTNIRIEVTSFSMSQQEALQLRFATLDDLPDIGLRLDMPEELLGDATEGGYIVELTDELLAEYAPYWANFLNEHPLADKLIRGMRVGLPNCDYVEYVGNFREQLLINKTWLDELGLEVPTTVSEFTAVLQAFKDNAGVGSIPESVIPFYYQWDHRISGMFDILGFWGITVTQTHWLAIDDGQVVFQGINPDIIEPLKYLQELYALGLTPAESFTDDRSMSIARTNSEEPYIGFFTSYANPNPDDYLAIAPMDTQTGVSPVIRKQEFTRTGTNDFIIFSGNQYVEESLALIDWIASNAEATANFQIGMQGYFWDYDENGLIKPYDTSAMSTEELRALDPYCGFGNFIAGIRADDFYAQYNDIGYENPIHRAWLYENVYKSYIPEGETNYIAASTGDDDLDLRRTDLANDIFNLRSTTLARWITGQGDIDAEWDEYVQKMYDIGLEEYLELCQMGYDTLNIN